MKRNVLAFLLLTLTLALLCACAQAAGLNRTLPVDGGHISDACTVNGAWYTLTENTVSRLSEDGSTAEPIGRVTSAWSTRLFALDGQIAWLDTSTGAYGVFAEQTAVEKGVLAPEVLNGEAMVDGIAVYDGQLYLLLTRWNEEGVDKRVWRADFTQNVLVAGNLTDISSISAAPEGLLLTNRSGEVSLYSPTLRSTLRTFQPKSKGTGYVWDGESLCYVDSKGQLCREKDGTVEVKAYLPVMYMDSSARAQRHGDTYALVSGGTLYLRDTSGDGHAEQTLLRIMGLDQQDIATRYIAEHPETAVQLVSAGSDFSSIQMSITSGDTIDLYVVSAPGALADLVDKGYAAPLTDPTLVDLANQLYPAFQQAVIRDGQLMAFPVSILPDTWTLNRTKWAEAGLGAEPTTYGEIFAAARLWAEEKAEDFPDFCLMTTPLGFEGLISDMIRQQVLAQEAAGEPVTFDTPAMREALQSALDCRSLLEGIEDEGMYMPLVMGYSQYMGAGYNDSDLVVNMLQPALSDGSARTTPVTLQVFVLNPRSAHKEEAMGFIRYFYDHMYDTTRYELTATLSEPLRTKGFEEKQQEAREEIAQLSAQLATLSEADKKTAQERIALLERQMDRREETWWAVTKEDVTIWQGIAEHLTVPLRTLYAGYSAQRAQDAALQQVIHRFCQGQLSMDQLLKELQQKGDMMILEDQ